MHKGKKYRSGGKNNFREKKYIKKSNKAFRFRQQNIFMEARNTFR
jgi:hypothetical protein